MSDEITPLSQGISFLGFLNAKLRDLSGYDVLMNELLQNADDTKNPVARTIIFDVQDKALIVENDGVFSNCGQIPEEECPWLNGQKKHRCDFHRFRWIAGADKRGEEDTTGAFGIGFIAVYQITDHPELISSGLHWQMFPEKSEDYRIASQKDNTSHIGTRFIFPWATDSTTVRTKLSLSAINSEDITRFHEEISAATPKAILFLKNVETIEIKRNGILSKRVQRVNEENKILVQDGDDTQLWYTFTGNFEKEETRLRQRHRNLIEAKRKSKTIVALASEDMEKRGVFCATLPTQQSTQLPLHINADFYTETSRKRISFENNNEGEWNTAAVKASACALALSLSQLPELLGHKALWNLFAQVKRVHDEAKQERYDGVLGSFWERIEECAKTTPIVYSSQGDWCKPEDIPLLRGAEEEKCLHILEILKIRVVHPDLRSHYDLLDTMKVPKLNPFYIAEALLEVAFLDKPIPYNEAPEWLQQRENQEVLATTIQMLMRRNKQEPNYSLMQERIASCAIAPSVDGYFRTLGSLWRTGKSVVALLSPLKIESKLLALDAPSGLHSFIRELDVNGAIQLLEGVEKHVFQKLWSEQPEQLIAIIEWLSSFASDFDANSASRDRVQRLRMWPSGETLHTLTELVVPGDFTDPFGQTLLIDDRVVAKCRGFLLQSLKATELTFKNYSTLHIPRSFARGLSVDKGQCRRLVQMLSKHRQEIEDDTEIKNKLSSCAFIECSDSELYTSQRVYFPSDELTILLGEKVPTVILPLAERDSVKHLYQALGVTGTARPPDVIEHIRKIVKDYFTDANRATIRRIFLCLGKMFKDNSILSEQYAPLKQLAWLPTVNSYTRWATPSNVNSRFQDYLFETTGNFLDMERKEQEEVSDFISFLGIKNPPTCTQVVDHLLNCANSQIKVNMQVYVYLNRNTNEKAVCILRDKLCIYLEENGYVSPQQVFWNPHGFDPYLLQLGDGYRDYRTLFDLLGVRDDPRPKDVIETLLEIEVEGNSEPIDEAKYVLVMHCWCFLTDSLTQKEVDASDLKTLQGQTLIPDSQKRLKKPTEVFYEDRHNLKGRFNEYFDESIIPYTREECPAMIEAGLRPLSSVIEARLVECGNPSPANEIVSRLQERLFLIERVIYGEDDFDITRLDYIKIFHCEPLQIGYTTQALGTTYSMPPVAAISYYDQSDEILYIQRDAGPALWSALARELSFFLSNSSSTTTVASGIKDVLSADSFEDADAILNELDYPLLPSHSEIQMPVSIPIDVEGEDWTATDTPSEEEQGIKPRIEEDNSQSQPIAPSIGTSRPQPSLDSSQPRKENERDRKPTPRRSTGNSTSGGGQSDKPLESNSSGVSLPLVGSRDEHSSAPDSNHDTTDVQEVKGHQGGRLRSYVFPMDNDKTANDEAQEKRSNVGRKGMERVLTAEVADGRRVKEMPPMNPGYDIQSEDTQGQEYYIEVKSLSGYWGKTGVGLSKTQFELAQELDEQYWLYVVECAEDDENFNIIRIQNPARRVNQFLFDDGWRDLDIEALELK